MLHTKELPSPLEVDRFISIRVVNFQILETKAFPSPLEVGRFIYATRNAIVVSHVGFRPLSR